MARMLLVGIASGVAAALLFACVASGSMLAVLLFYLAPLPLMIAGLGWSHLAGLAGAIVGSAGLLAAFGGWFGLVFLLGVGLPSWWLSYLALLARSSDGGSGSLEWYPVGRLVMWCAVLATLMVVVAIPMFGTDAEAFQSGLKTAFDRLLRSQATRDAPLSLPGVNDPNRVLDFLVAVIPPAAAVVSTLTSLANLWLAAKVVAISGRLGRPWPDLRAMKVPRLAAGLLAAGIGLSFLPDLLGIVAGVLACTLLIVYALLGFVILHMTTVGINGRGFVLAGIYAAVAVFGWPVLLLTLLGLVDNVIDIRGRFGRTGPSGSRS
jgi:Predicted membrane protein (DUF2232)